MKKKTQQLIWTIILLILSKHIKSEITNTSPIQPLNFYGDYLSIKMIENNCTKNEVRTKVFSLDIMKNSFLSGGIPATSLKNHSVYPCVFWENLKKQMHWRLSVSRRNITNLK